MLERLLLLASVAVLLGAAVLVARLLARRRALELMASPSSQLWDALGLQADARPTIVAFSTPSCAACHTAQLPAIERLSSRLGQERLRVVRVDAADRPEVARAFGVMTVPSTVVLAADGPVAAVNQGFASSERLAAQLR